MTSPNRLRLYVSAGLGFLLAAPLSAAPAHANGNGETMSREQVIVVGEQMMDAQLAVFKKHNKFPHADWEAGVLWAGIADFSKVSARTEYTAALMKSGEEDKWTPIVSYPEVGQRLTRYLHNADDLCIGQAWLSAYDQTKKTEILGPISQRIDAASEFIEANNEAVKEADHLEGNLRIWNWCDALFMAPAVHAHLSAITGDPKYRNAMHTEWWRASAVMYDESEHLYFRDPLKIFPKKKTASGQKVFWARGNGWVLGGLARVLEHVPQDDPFRPRYENQLREMSTRLASLQRPDGTWPASLLDFEEFPYSESSGTALNCFAMAWGINHGLLDEKTFRPVVEKAWAALLAARRPDGLLGYVQGVAHGPAPVYENGSRTYGTGAFLMAAAQLAQLAPLNLPPAPVLTALPSPDKK